MRERIDQRVLGALRLVDRVSQVPVRRAMKVSATNASMVRNASGLYVITGAPALASHSREFQQPPTTPAPGSVALSITVEDPQVRYLPRLLRLDLPRDAAPANAGNPDSLFHPLAVLMYPASTASVATNWSSIRVSVTSTGGAAVAGCLLRVVDEAEGKVLASGLSDERGEALVIVPGVPITKFADDGDEGDEDDDDDTPPVMITTLPVRLEVSAGATSWPLDPDLLEQNHAANIKKSKLLTLKTGRMETVAINLT